MLFSLKKRGERDEARRDENRDQASYPIFKVVSPLTLAGFGLIPRAKTDPNNSVASRDAIFIVC